MTSLKRNKMLNPIYIKLLFLSFSLLYTASTFAQVEGSETRYVRIGSLQSHYTAYGSERAWNNSYYEGLRWPAEYLQQDNAVIKRAWIGAENYIDKDGLEWPAYAISLTAGFVGTSIFPMELKQTARFAPPAVYVDGNNVTAPYASDVDDINPNQIPDRIITNVVNTSMGLTMKRTIYVFSQQYHDNYHIKIFTFTNTGNVDYDDEIERHGPINGVRVGWGTRYSCSREGAYRIGNGQSWGKHSWVTKRGENYADHYMEEITPANPIVDWLRCGFSWAGQSELNDFDNIGAPYVTRDGRLTSPHHVGTVVLHVDKSITDRDDDPLQPTTLGWHAGDTYPGITSVTRAEIPKMVALYSMLSGIPHNGLGGNDRFYENYIDKNSDPWLNHNDGGGTNLWINYGPFDIPEGDSIVIVEAEGINGLSRPMCELIGRRWKKAYLDANDKGPFELPDHSITTDKDKYKDAWVMTGQDSIMKTFGRAKRNFDLGFLIPQPPEPPSLFKVKSGGDKIILSWAPSASEGEEDFGGYKIFRIEGKTDTLYNEIFACGYETKNPQIVNYYEDLNAVRGVSYYYYIVAFSKGLNNETNANPHGKLYSSKYYTRTTEPAYLRRIAGENLSGIRIVPNPYYFDKSKNLQFPGEQNKIMFYNIPKYCQIKIFTERGDLVKTIHHDDGSGDEAWFNISSSRQIIVSGVYIAHIEVTQDIFDLTTQPQRLILKKGASVIKKFIVVR